jgi:hypothetical protein
MSLCIFDTGPMQENRNVRGGRSIRQIRCVATGCGGCTASGRRGRHVGLGAPLPAELCGRGAAGLPADGVGRGPRVRHPSGCPAVCLSLCLSIRRSIRDHKCAIRPAVRLCACPFVCLSVVPSVTTSALSVWLSVCVPFSLPVCPSFHPWPTSALSVHLYVCVSALRLPVFPSMRLPGCLLCCLSISLCVIPAGAHHIVR